MGLALAGELWTAVAGERGNHARDGAVRLGRALAASFCASLFNPYGINLYTHIYQYLTDSFLMHHIQEMHSPDFRTVAAKCLAVMLLLTTCVAATRRSRLRPGEMLVLVFFAYEALFAARNIPLACIVLTLTVAPLLTPSEERGTILSPLHLRLREFSLRMGALESRARGHAWAIAFAVVTLVACANGGRLLGTQVIHANFNADKFPLRAVEFLAQHPPTGPIFTTDAWGGYVIYRVWPNQRVVVDDRHDMYGSEYMKRYLKIVDGNWDWQQQLQATGARSALVPTTSAIGSLLRLTPEWRLVYDDGQALLFERIQRTNPPDSHPTLPDRP